MSAAAIDAILMLAAALLLRCWWFGNPVVQVDEQFYLLVGDRMLHGQLPFIDIWDRKPIGLFLLYALTRLLGGGGIVQYQVTATVFAGAAAFIVARMARHIAGANAARLAGLTALLWMLIFDGAGGQAPIFYNAFVACAAWIVLRLSLAREDRATNILASGAVAMTIIGVAIQIKYTVLFEGISFGLLLLWTAWRNGLSPKRLIICGLAWVALALLPTAIAFGSYIQLGYARAFSYANFMSIGDRPPTEWPIIARRMAVAITYAVPLILAAWVGLRGSRADADQELSRRFMLCWLVGAVVGFLAIGTFYKHYFLPVIVPLAIAAAPAFEAGLRRSGRRISVAILILASGGVLAAATGRHRIEVRGDERKVSALLAAIPSRFAHNIYVFAGDPVLYYLTQSQLPTRYAFPNHLNEAKEAPAIGVDAGRELDRVLMHNPAVIFSTDRPDEDANLSAWHRMSLALASNYHPIASVRVHKQWRIAYLRNDLSNR